jgi:hypothetical protein
VISSDFETGVVGNTISTADAGSPTAWDIVTISAGGTLTYDNTYAASGRLSAKCVQAGTPGQVGVRWNAPFGTQTDHYGRVYLYAQSYPSTFVRPVSALSGASTGAFLRLNNLGQLQILDSTNTLLATTTAAIILNQWVRAEWHMIHSATVGQIEAKLFNNPYSAVATETITSAANLNTLASADRIAFGHFGDSPAGYTFWVDSPIAAAAIYPGPIPTMNQPALLSAAGGGLL